MGKGDSKAKTITTVSTDTNVTLGNIGVSEEALIGALDVVAAAGIASQHIASENARMWITTVGPAYQSLSHGSGTGMVSYAPEVIPGVPLTPGFAILAAGVAALFLYYRMRR